MGIFPQSGCNLAKWLYSGKSCCILPKWWISREVDVFGISGCYQAKMVVFGQKWLYSDKVVVSGKMVVFGQKWLFLAKSGCIREKWF